MVDQLADRETLRRFLDEGPALLLPAAERARIAALPLPEGLAAANAFTTADPLPETPANELAQGIAPGVASEFGARFYGLPLNAESITLERRDWLVPQSYSYAGGDVLVPLRAGESLAWRLI